ncbi:hypothetical protein GCM10010228_81600 [Streptomyces massasporeus]|nr:hypothetical protein GCM10010228_81600 [Streptomyces massasporeus]
MATCSKFTRRSDYADANLVEKLLGEDLDLPHGEIQRRLQEHDDVIEVSPLRLRNALFTAEAG